MHFYNAISHNFRRGTVTQCYYYHSIAKLTQELCITHVNPVLPTKRATHCAY